MENTLHNGQPYDEILQLASGGKGTDVLYSDPITSSEVRIVTTLSVTDANNNLTGWKVEIGRIGVERVIYSGGAVTAGNAGVMPYEFQLADLERVKVTLAGATSGDQLTVTMRGIKRGGEAPLIPVIS